MATPVKPAQMKITGMSWEPSTENRVSIRLVDRDQKGHYLDLSLDDARHFSVGDEVEYLPAAIIHAEEE